MAEKIAVITGASTGIGYSLAKLAAADGYGLILCADEDKIHESAAKLRDDGAEVEAMVVDLSSRSGVEEFWSTIGNRPVHLFCANAGRALGQAFADQDWSDVKHLIDLNILQTTTMLHRVGRRMRDAGEGRILLTGSIGGYVPGPYNTVYNATKAYLDSISYALQDEWRDNGVTLTCLMPGLTETPLFERDESDLDDAPVAKLGKDDPDEVARRGYEAVMSGKRGAIPGLHNRVITMLSGVVPEAVVARIHRAGAKPQN